MWYFVAATLDAKTGRATLYQEGVANRYNGLLGKVTPLDYRSHVSEVFRFRQKHLPETPFLDGRLARLARQARPLRLADCFAARSIVPVSSNRALTREELDKIKNGENAAGRWPGRLLEHHRRLYRSRHWRPRDRRWTLSSERQGLQSAGSRANRLELERTQRLFPSGAAGIRRSRISRRRDDRLQLEGHQNAAVAGRFAQRRLRDALARRRRHRSWRGIHRLLRSAQNAATDGSLSLLRPRAISPTPTSISASTRQSSSRCPARRRSSPKSTSRCTRIRSSDIRLL